MIVFCATADRGSVYSVSMEEESLSHILLRTTGPHSNMSDSQVKARVIGERVILPRYEHIRSMRLLPNREMFLMGDTTFTISRWNTSCEEIATCRKCLLARNPLCVWGDRGCHPASSASSFQNLLQHDCPFMKKNNSQRGRPLSQSEGRKSDSLQLPFLDVSTVVPVGTRAAENGSSASASFHMLERNVMESKLVLILVLVAVFSLLFGFTLGVCCTTYLKCVPLHYRTHPNNVTTIRYPHDGGGDLGGSRLSRCFHWTMDNLVTMNSASLRCVDKRETGNAMDPRVHHCMYLTTCSNNSDRIPLKCVNCSSYEHVAPNTMSSSATSPPTATSLNNGNVVLYNQYHDQEAFINSFTESQMHNSQLWNCSLRSTANVEDSRQHRMEFVYRGSEPVTPCLHRGLCNPQQMDGVLSCHEKPNKYQYHSSQSPLLSPHVQLEQNSFCHQ